ncbi:MAG TPA: DMT family transporter [Gammaproteobacteria bacterium]|nr:DMT family transporter [Gammaproteobacteria bacterium]
MSSRPTGSLQANANCFAAMLLWATGFVALEYLLDDWGVLSLSSLRLTVSVVFLVLWWGWTEGWAKVFGASWRKGLIIGGFGWGVGSVLLLMGQKLSDPVTVTIVVAMMPIAGAATEIVFDNRRLSWRLVVGIILAVLGGYLATGAQLTQEHFGFGVALCLGAILLFAWVTRATTRQLETLSRTGQTAVTLCGGMLVTLAWCGISIVAGLGETHIGTIDTGDWLPLFIVLLPSSGIAQLLWIHGAGKLGILLASFHMNAVPFYVMVILVSLSLGQWHWLQAGAVALVALGVLVSQMSPGVFTRGRKTSQTRLD